MLRGLKRFATGRSIEAPIKTATYFYVNVYNGRRNRDFNFQAFSRLNMCTSNSLCQDIKKDEIAKFTETKDKPFSELSLETKVLQTGKDVTYISIILFGIGVAGVMVYLLGKELISGQSPYGIYNAAHKLCLKDIKVVNALGEPIKAYGELSRRGRRRHIRSTEFLENGIKTMNLQFYLEGCHDKGTVFVQAKQDSKGKYEIIRIILQLKDYPKRTIVVLDKNDEMP